MPAHIKKKKKLKGVTIKMKSISANLIVQHLKYSSQFNLKTWPKEHTLFLKQAYNNLDISSTTFLDYHTNQESELKCFKSILCFARNIYSLNPLHKDLLTKQFFFHLCKEKSAD